MRPGGRGQVQPVDLGNGVPRRGDVVEREHEELGPCRDGSVEIEGDLKAGHHLIGPVDPPGEGHPEARRHRLVEIRDDRGETRLVDPAQVSRGSRLADASQVTQHRNLDRGQHREDVAQPIGHGKSVYRDRANQTAARGTRRGQTLEPNPTENTPVDPLHLDLDPVTDALLDQSLDTVGDRILEHDPPPEV
ncbi:MAG: hypothetical protein ACOC6J_01550 [Spirochaetota bacterium]